MGLLDGKVIVVVGGTSGIGEATALCLAKEGAKVVIAGRRTELGEEVAKKINDEIESLHDVKEGEKVAMFIKCDVTNEEDVKALIEKTVEIWGRLDGAFNNAGIVKCVWVFLCCPSTVSNSHALQISRPARGREMGGRD